VGGVGGSCLRRAEYACGCDCSHGLACGYSRALAGGCSRALFGGAAACTVRHDAGGLGKAERDGTVSVPRRGEWERNFAYAVRDSGEAQRRFADG